MDFCFHIFCFYKYYKFYNTFLLFENHLSQEIKHFLLYLHTYLPFLPLFITFDRLEFLYGIISFLIEEFLSIFFVIFFLGPHPQHMEVPRLGVKLELHLPTYATVTEMADLTELHLRPTSQLMAMLHP